MHNLLRTNPEIQSAFSLLPDSYAPSRRINCDSLKSPDLVCTWQSYLHDIRVNLLGGAKAILPYRALQRDLRPGHSTRDCAHNTLLVHEKLETDVKTADLACKQIQTLLCCVITRTDPVGEYNNVYLHTKTEEKIMSQAMHFNVRMLNTKLSHHLREIKRDRQ